MNKIEGTTGMDVPRSPRIQPSQSPLPLKRRKAGVRYRPEYNEGRTSESESDCSEGENKDSKDSVLLKRNRGHQSPASSILNEANHNTLLYSNRQTVTHKTQAGIINNNYSGSVILSLFVCFLLGAPIIWYIFFRASDVVSPEDKLRNELKYLKEKFPSQAKDLWASFTGGIRMIVEDDPNRPSVFLLMHNGNRGTSECLAREVGKVAAKFLKDEEQLPVIIDGSSLKNNESLLEDHGFFTAEYAPIMQRIGVMIVINLQDIPGSIAQTFHTFCDEVNPLVQKAVYLFTLETSNSWNITKPTKIAEDTLTNLWRSELDRDIMDPLIVRMTSQAVVIETEIKIPCNT